MTGEQSGGLRWWGWLLLVAAVLLLAFAVWFWGFAPSSGARQRAVDAACSDASSLRRAGLVDEALKADGPITAHRLDCPFPEQRLAIRQAGRAAYFREQGDQYLRAARLSRAAERRAKNAKALGVQRRRALFFAHALRVDIRRARKGYRRSFSRDPYDAATVKGLAAVLKLMPVPPDASADARCRIARSLRRAHALDAAATVYAQALRTGRTGRCDPEDELRMARSDRERAIAAWHRGDAAEKLGHRAAARRAYIAALAADPSLTQAKRSLDATKPPNPLAETRRGQLDDIGHWFAGTAETAKKTGAWLTDHEGAAAVALAALALLVLLAMCALFFLTRRPRGARLVGRFHLPAFCRLRLRIHPFTPADVGDTSTTVFAYWLEVPLLEPHEPGDESDTEPVTPLDAWDTTLEAWTVAGETTDGNLDRILASQPGILGAIVAWVKKAAPRRETQFVGYALQRCEHGPGLRALVKTRRGRPVAGKFWWATDLPGPPLTSVDQEGEARHALAIYAATWAHEAAELQ